MPPKTDEIKAKDESASASADGSLSPNQNPASYIHPRRDLSNEDILMLRETVPESLVQRMIRISATDKPEDLWKSFADSPPADRAWNPTHQEILEYFGESFSGDDDDDDDSEDEATVDAEDAEKIPEKAVCASDDDIRSKCMILPAERGSS